MKYKLAAAVIISLFLLSSFPTVAEDLDPWINLNTDATTYRPGDSISFFLTSNINDSGSIDIYFKSEIVKRFVFNLTNGMAQISWKTDLYMVNDTYTAVAILDSLEINSTRHFGILRTDIVDDRFQRLELNVSIYYKSNMLYDYEINITNLYTRDSQEFDDILDYYYITYDDDVFDMLMYKPGHAIQIYVRTTDKRYAATIVFAAHTGVNQIIIDLDKLPDSRQILSFAFPLLLIAAIVFFAMKTRKKSKGHNYLDDIDPWNYEQNIS